MMWHIVVGAVIEEEKVRVKSSKDGQFPGEPGLAGVY